MLHRFLYLVCSRQGILVNNDCSLAGLRVCLIYAVLSLTGLVLLSGCGGGGGGGLPAIVSIDITDDFTAHPGDVVDFHVWGEQETSGWRWLYNEDLTWESSNPAVGTIDSLGEFTATGLGTTVVTGTYEDLPPDSATVTVVEPGPQPTADYYPLDIGYWWEYTGSEVEPGGVHLAQEITLTVSCLRQVVGINEVWYELRVQYSDPDQSPRYMYFQHNDQVDNQGLQELFIDDTTVYKLKAPVEVGTTWTDDQDPQHTFEIESVTDEVTVPAGTFENCVKVREEGVDEYGEYTVLTWFNDDVGVVKSQLWDYDPDTGEYFWTYQELTDYSVGG